MIHMPKGAKVLKGLLSQKEKLEKAASSVKLSEKCSAINQRSLPQKERDPGSFTLPCLIRPLAVKNVLADLGAILSLLLKSPVYHEPSVAIVVSANVVDRSIGTDNPHLPFRYFWSLVDHVAHLTFENHAAKETPSSQRNIDLISCFVVTMLKREGETVIMGDFNEVRSEHERFGSIFNYQGASVFNNFISLVGLIDLPLEGYKSMDVNGLNGIIRLKKKLQLLKSAIKVWSKEARTRLHVNNINIQHNLSNVEKIIDQVQAVAATDDSPAVPEHTTVETPMNMSPANKAHFE
nr:RNA-directed DNA polymerase, eukaryota [Tanacetum cinerariifolium]